MKFFVLNVERKAITPIIVTTKTVLEIVEGSSGKDDTEERSSVAQPRLLCLITDLSLLHLVCIIKYASLTILPCPLCDRSSRREDACRL